MAFDNDELNKRREEREQERKIAESQNKLLKIGLIVTAVTLVLCGAALLVTYGVVNFPAQQDPDLQVPPSTSESEPTEQTEPTPQVPDQVIHFVAGGDLNVTDKTVAAGTAVSGYDYTTVFMDVASILSRADLAALNFEGSLFGAPYGSEHKSAPIQMVQALQNAGVDLLQTANSQSVVNGLSGLRSTLQAIRSSGMEPLGAYGTPEEFRESGGFIIRNVQGIRVAIVAFTKGMDGMGLPDGNEDCVNLLYKDYNSAYQKVDTQGIKEILQDIRAQKPDVTIALLHWGSEYNSKTSATQDTITKLMLEQGVDAIIGSHSHYVQKAVFDRDKGTLVAYSLGDFFGDAQNAGTDYSILLDLEITKNGTTGACKITGVECIPIFTLDETETGGGMRVVRIREAMAAYENNYISKISEKAYLAMKNAIEKITPRMELS